MMTDEQLRSRGSLTAQAAKLAPAEIVEKVRVPMLQLRAAANAVPPTRFNDPPAAGEWSANEVMAHVVEAGRHFGSAVERLLDGRPPGAPRDAGGGGAQRGVAPRGRGPPPLRRRRRAAARRPASRRAARRGGARRGAAT